MITSDEHLIELFNTLPSYEQDVLLVLAVNYVPIGQTSFITLLKQVGFDPETIKIVNRDFKDRFQKMGFVMTTQEGWYCSHAINNRLMQIALHKPWFNRLAQQIIMEKEGISYMPTKYMLQQQTKKLRLFLYQGNETGFEANIAFLYNEFNEHFESVIQQLFFERFNRKWFMQLSEKIRFLVLQYTIWDNYLSIEPHAVTNRNDVYDLLEDSFGNTKPNDTNVMHFVLEQRLFRGSQKNAAEWLENDYSPKGLMLRAVLNIFENHYDESIPLFNEALKIHRKGNKRKAVLGSIYDFFYGLMLLRHRSLTNLKQLDQYMQLFIGKNNVISPVNAILYDALYVYQGIKKIEESRYLSTKRESPYESLVQILLLYWLDETKRISSPLQQSTFLAPLAHHCQQAHDVGFGWYAAISATLLQRLNYTNKACEKIAKNYENESFIHLVDAFPKSVAWERALEALSQISTLKPQSTEIAAPSELRLIWTLDIEKGNLIFEPKEQRLGKNGTWSKGRVISLKRLHNELDTFHYLTDQDLRICKRIRKVSNASDYYYYHNETYLLPEDILLDAVGHPHVYWASQLQYQSPIDIQTAELQLLVQEHEDQLHLTLIPQIARDSTIVVQKTATGVLVYNINDQHRQVATILGENGLTIPCSARQRVMDSISSVASMLTVQSNIVGMTTQADLVDADHRLHLHLQPIGQGLQIEIFVQPFLEGGPLYKPGVGGTTVLAEIEGKQLQTTRNFTTEAHYVAQLHDQCPYLYPDNALKWQLDDAESALETLLSLQELGDFAVLEWPKGKKIKLSRELGLVQAKFSVRKEKDWFSVEGELILDEHQVINIQRLMQLLTTSSSRFLQLDDGQVIALTTELRQRLDDLRSVGDIREDKIQFHSLAAHALDDITEGMSITASKPWNDQLKRLNEMADFLPKVPSTLQGELRDYQREGFQWMSRLAYWGAGACLADDMGLGKTIQSLALILSRAADGATLILAPTSVCINWVEECERFAPTLNVQIFGTGDRQTMLDGVGPFDLIICSYGLLQTEIERLQTVQWHTLIADEAQAIKNTLTKRSKAAMSLQANFKMVTTGTPIENHLGELWNLFNFINPGLLGTLSQFNERFANPIENNQDHKTQQRLKKLLRPFILRRLKNDVLTELPARTEITLHVELSQEEWVMYEALRRQALETMQTTFGQTGQQSLQVLAEIMKLRRACCHPRLVIDDSPLSSSKLQAFEELIAELLDNQHKALVFSQFVGHLTLIRELLEQKGIAYHYLDGSTPVAQRKKAMNAFQAGEGDLFLISLKAGGTGLNLTAADYVIHMDPWWNPAVEDQASDRAHRMGQKRPVTVYRLVAKNTIEDKIVALHHHKRDLANSLLEGGDMSGKLSVDDMLALLRDMP